MHHDHYKAEIDEHVKLNDAEGATLYHERRPYPRVCYDNCYHAKQWPEMVLHTNVLSYEEKCRNHEKYFLAAQTRSFKGANIETQ